MFRKSISVLITICMLLACFSPVGLAEEVQEQSSLLPGVILDAQFGEDDNDGFKLLNEMTGAELTTEPISSGSDNYVLKFTATDHNPGGTEHIAVKVNGDEGIKFVDGRNIIIETKFRKTNTTDARVYLKYNMDVTTASEEAANLYSLVALWHDGTVKYANGTTGANNDQISMVDAGFTDNGTNWLTAKVVIKGTSLLADMYLYDQSGNLVKTVTDADISHPTARVAAEATNPMTDETHLKTLAFRTRQKGYDSADTAATDVHVDYVKVSVEEEVDITIPEIMPLTGKFTVELNSETELNNLENYFELYNDADEKIENADVTVSGNKLTYSLGQQTKGEKYTLKVDKDALTALGYVFADDTTEYEITASDYYLNADFGASDKGGFELLNKLTASNMTVEPIEENSSNYVLKYSAANHTTNGTAAQGGDEHILVKVNGDAGIEYEEGKNIIVEARFKKNAESGRVYLKHNINVDTTNEEGHNLYTLAALWDGTSNVVKYPGGFGDYTYTDKETSTQVTEKNWQVNPANVGEVYSTGNYNDRYVTVKAVIKGNTHKADLYFYDENGENEVIIKDAELGVPTGRSDLTNDTHLKTLAFRTRNAATDVYVDYIKVYEQLLMELEISVPETMPLTGNFDVSFTENATFEGIEDYFKLYNPENELLTPEITATPGKLSFALATPAAEGDVYTLKVDKAGLNAIGFIFEDGTTDYRVKASNYIINDNFGANNDTNGWALKSSNLCSLATELIPETNNYALKLGLINTAYISNKNNYVYKAFDEIAYEDGVDIVIRTKFKYTDTNKGTAEAPDTTYARTYFKFNVPAEEAHGYNVFSFFEVKADNGFAVANGKSGLYGAFTTDYTSASYKGGNKGAVDGQWFDTTIKIHGKTQTAAIYVTDEAGNVVVDAKEADLSQDASYTDFATDALKNLAFRLRQDLSELLVDYVKVYKEKTTTLTVPEIVPLTGNFDVTFNSVDVPDNVEQYFTLYNEDGTEVENVEITTEGNVISYSLGKQTEGKKYVLKADAALYTVAGYKLSDTGEYSITASEYYINEEFGEKDNGGFELLNKLTASNMTVEPIEENSSNYVLKYSAANHTLNGTAAQGGDEHILVKVNGDAGIEYEEGKNIIVEARFKKDAENGRVYLKHNINVDTTNEEGHNLYTLAALWDGTSNVVKYPGGFGDYTYTDKETSTQVTEKNWQVNPANVGEVYSTRNYNDRYVTVKAVIKGNTHKADLYFYDENGENEVIIKDAELGVPTGRSDLTNDTHLKTLAFRTRNAATDVYVDYIKVYEQLLMELDFDGKRIDETGNMYIWADNDTLTRIKPYVQLTDSNGTDIEIVTTIKGDGSLEVNPVNALDVGDYTLKVDTAELETYSLPDSAITVKVMDNTVSYNENFDGDHGWKLNTFSMGADTDAEQNVIPEGENNFLRVSLTKQGNIRNGVTTAYKFGENGFVMDSDGYTVIEAKLRSSGSNFRKYFKINPDYTNGFFANTRTLFAFDYPEAGKLSYAAQRYTVTPENAEAYYQGNPVALETYTPGKWYTVRAVFDNTERSARYYMLDENGVVVAETPKISMSDPEPQDFTVFGAAGWYNFADHKLTDREQLRYIEELAFVLRNTPAGLTTAETLDIDDVKLYNTSNLSGIVADKVDIGLKKDGIDFEGELTAGTYYPKADIELASGEAESFVLIGALYNGAHLEKLTVYPFSGAKGEFTADNGIVVSDATDRKIKVFLWDSLANAIPVCESNEFNYASLSFYVDPVSGSDAASGLNTAEPLKTIEAAQTKLKDAVDNGFTKGTAEIVLREGTYYADSPITFSNKDVAVTLKAYNGEEAKIVGGTALPLADAEPVTDPDILSRLSDENAGSNLYCIDISHLEGSIPAQSLPGAYNLKSVFTKYGERFGVTYPYESTTCEVFFENELMTNARYPNSGYLDSDTFTKNYEGAVPRNWQDDRKNTDEYVPDEKDESNNYLRDITDGFKLDYTIERADNWAGATDALMFGYWANGWATQTVPLKNIDADNNILTALHPSNYGISDENLRFYIYNLLEEIDTKGEYYIDRENNKLYFYRSEDMTDDKNLYISLSETPLIKINNAKNVSVKGITLTASRGNGINISNSNGIKILDCNISNTADFAVYMDYATNSIVDGCTIKDVNGGISVSHAGDTSTLAEGRNIVSNNDISNFSRLNKTYKYAIHMSGVANKVTHNKIYNTEHTAINFAGCNNEISYNDISDVCKEVNDASAIYVGRTWLNRGNVIKYNYIHDIQSDNTVSQSEHPCSGVYFDDHYADGNVYGNIFENIVGYGVILHGGREINVENNIFIDCGTNSAFFTNYELSYNDYLEAANGNEEVAKVNYATQFITHESGLENALKNYDDSVWSVKFPEFWTTAKTNPEEFRKQSYNTYLNNIEYNSELFVHQDYYNKEDLTVEDAYKANIDDFVNYQGGNFNLTDAAKSKFAEFVPIEFSIIGIEK